MMKSVAMVLMALIHVTYSNKQHFYSDDRFRGNAAPPGSGDHQQLTREIHIQQGTLQGVIVEPFQENMDLDLPRVERYLGIPYAAAPTGPLRFMPPGAPPRWDKHKVFDSLPPVCPQNLPSINKSMMSRGRYKYMQRLLQFLKRFSQSEDCLYLNIYAPAYVNGDIEEKYPVMVFIHGESFEWNSGNPYDGSVLASYGRVIVITFNFRLGILGFMKPGIAENTPSNFGLLDQIAALKWVQDNIGEFGGDRNLVTLMGHDTGAACVNFLMLSPVSRGGANAEGLFHRAILMSGSALSDWALVSNPAPFTMQVAERLNCNPPEMTNCLRVKRLEDIMSLKITGPRFMTKFGPVIDGAVVPNDPFKIMNEYKDLFKSYDLMFGLTELESYHLLDAITLHAGILEKDFEATLRAYLAARYEYDLPDIVYSMIIQEYTDIRNDGTRRIDADHRDILLDILSDARVVSPLTTTANLHLTENPKSYFYIFGHNSVFGEYSMLDRSVNGEEIPFIFGIPKGGPKYHYEDNASKDEILLSEQIMRCWTNFAKTGNPNAPRRFEIPTHRSFAYNFDLDWPEYDFMNKSYMNFGIPPAVGLHYRDKFMQFWNVKLPLELEKTIARKLEEHSFQQQHFLLHPSYNRGTTTSIHASEVIHRNKIDQIPPTRLLDRPWTYNNGPSSEDKIEVITEESAPKQLEEDVNIKNANITMNIVIGLGILFLIVNILAFTGLYYKRDKLKSRERDLKTQLDGNTLVNMGDSRDTNDFNESHGCNVLKMVTSKYDGETYDIPIKNGGEGSTEDGSKFSPIFKLKRQYSTSTIDPNTKVRNWIAQEIVQKYSPRFLRRNTINTGHQKDVKQKKNTQLKSGKETIKSNIVDDELSLGQTPTRPVSHIDNITYDDMEKPSLQDTHTNSSSGIPTLNKKPKKVSVAIDATPAARSGSILEQQPIEITKSLNYDSGLVKSNLLRRSATVQDFLDCSSIDENTIPQSRVESTLIKIEHSHSKSDPVDTQYYKNDPNALYEYTSPQIPLKLQTFTTRNETTPNIINVTSRDDEIAEDKEIMSPAEALMTIKRRNYPKVLPDLPHSNETAIKRRSLPPPGHLCQFLSRGKPKLNYPPSLAPRNVTKIPPAPPPRTTSTMDRSRVDSEDKDVKSTLHVGQLLPKKVKPIHVHVNDHDVRTNPDQSMLGQPIYDNVQSIRPLPKTIITTSGTAKKSTKPKVIIKPTIMKKPTERSDGKYIPHVTASNLPSKPTQSDDENFLESKKPDIIVAEHKSRLPKPLVSTKVVSSEKSSSSSNSTLDSNSGSSDTGTVVKRIC